MDNPYHILEASMRQAEHTYWAFFGVSVFLAVFGVAALCYVGYWSVQLIKAAIRALDRWNAPAMKRTQSALVAPQAPSDLVDELKYAPKR